MGCNTSNKKNAKNTNVAKYYEKQEVEERHDLSCPAGTHYKEGEITSKYIPIFLYG